MSTSLMANGLWMNAIPVQGVLCGVRTEVRPPREESVSALANLYRCRDGRWFMLTITGDERHWAKVIALWRLTGSHGSMMAFDDAEILRVAAGPLARRLLIPTEPLRIAS